MPKSKYQDIYKELKEKIETGQYSFEEMLPSESTLVGDYQCTRNTIRRALGALAQEGYIQPIHGKGVRVIYQQEPKTKFLVGGIETFKETAIRNHLNAKTKVVEFKEITIDGNLENKTSLPKGERAYLVKRVRYLDDKPLILDTSIYLKKSVPGLTEEIAEKSIYEYIEKDVGMQISLSKRSIAVDKVTPEDERLLDLDGFNCVATMTNQAFNSHGIIFEWTHSRHHPEYFHFETIATRNPKID